MKWSINKYYKDVKRNNVKISKHEIKNKEIFTKNKSHNTRNVKTQHKDKKSM